MRLLLVCIVIGAREIRYPSGVILARDLPSRGPAVRNSKPAPDRRNQD